MFTQEAVDQYLENRAKKNITTDGVLKDIEQEEPLKDFLLEQIEVLSKRIKLDTIDEDSKDLRVQYIAGFISCFCIAKSQLIINQTEYEEVEKELDNLKKYVEFLENENATLSNKMKDGDEDN